MLDRGTVYIVRGERECVAVSMDIRCGRERDSIHC